MAAPLRPAPTETPLPSSRRSRAAWYPIGRHRRRRKQKSNKFQSRGGGGGEGEEVSKMEITITFNVTLSCLPYTNKTVLDNHKRGDAQAIALNETRKVTAYLRCAKLKSGRPVHNTIMGDKDEKQEKPHTREYKKNSYCSKYHTCQSRFRCKSTPRATKKEKRKQKTCLSLYG